jgi:hypothetical protein
MMKTPQQTLSNQPDSPETKKLKKLQERAIQQQACKELFRLRNANGELNYGDIKLIIDKYKSKGFSCVTRRNLRYRMGLLEERNGLLVTEMNVPMNGILIPALAFDEISPITENDNTTSVSVPIQQTAINNKQHLQIVNNCITKVALMVSEIRNNNDDRILPKHYLQQLIDSTESENSLPSGTIKPSTIRSRIRRNNLNGLNKRRVPLLNSIEPLIIQWCLKMAEIGMSLSRENVIELVNDLIKGTEFEKNICLT